MVFINLAILIQNRQNAATGCPRTFKMEAWGTQNDLPGHQNESPALRIEGQERQDGPSERPNGSPDGQWQPNLQFQVLPRANLSAHGSLRDGFWRPQGSDFGGSSINFEQTILSIQLHFMHAIPIHSVPFHSISIPHHSIPFHSIPCRSIPIHSTPFHCNFTPRCSNVLGFRNSRVGCF